MRFLSLVTVTGWFAFAACSSASDEGSKTSDSSPSATTGVGSGAGDATGPSATTSTSGSTSTGSNGMDTSTGSDGATTSSGAGGATSSSSGSGGNACNLHQALACDETPPDPGAKSSWKNPLSYIVSAAGMPGHRGRDLFLAPNDAQWVLGQFVYGSVADQKLTGEQVDIYLLRDCGKQWETLGTATTSAAGKNPAVEGVDDTGGRVYFQIPQAKHLGIGRHRIHMVVKGDLTSTDQFIEVVAPGTKIFVSDVDGTLTASEYVEFTALLQGMIPDAHPDAADALKKLAAKGLIPFYLTARPEWLTARTREFLNLRGFPPGIVHTTLSATGAQGAAATTYKSAELAALKAKGVAFEFAFGNQASDGDAYENAKIQPVQHRVFFQLDDTHGGRRINAWSELLGEFGALPPYCQ